MRINLAVLLLIGVITPALAQDTRQEALQAFFASLAEAAETGDKTAYTSLFLPEAAVFLPHLPPLLGREQIGAYFDDFRKRSCRCRIVASRSR
jgi:ketosteroid isomerase-like protein